MIDEDVLDDDQRNGIRAWTKLVRGMDEERAIKFLTRIVTNLAGDQTALDAVLKATKDQLTH